MKFYMDTKKSFNLYMFHGGTNFGFTAGANNGGSGYEPGRDELRLRLAARRARPPQPASISLRKQLASYLPAGRNCPRYPAEIPAIKVPEIKLTAGPGCGNNCHQPWLWLDLPRSSRWARTKGSLSIARRSRSGGKRLLKFANLHDYARSSWRQFDWHARPPPRRSERSNCPMNDEKKRAWKCSSRAWVISTSRRHGFGSQRDVRRSKT